MKTLRIFCVLGALSVAGQPAAATEGYARYEAANGLKYTVIKPGSGNKPSVNDEVEIRFTSYDAKGELLEGTLNNVPVILPVGEMFAGLRQGLMMMPAGSVYQFDIPAHLGYQEEGKAGRQAASYRIELLRINP